MIKLFSDYRKSTLTRCSKLSNAITAPAQAAHLAPAALTQNLPLYRQLGLIGIVVLFFSGCATTTPVPDTPKQAGERSEVHTQLAWNYLTRGQYDVAREELDKALKIDSGSSRAHHIYGLLFNTLGDFKNASRHFSRAVQLNANNLDAQEDYAGFLCKNGKIEAGVRRYQKVIGNPRNNQVAMTRTRVGLCLLGNGKIDEAESFFREALEANPSIGIALSAMARISYETGRYLSGRAYIQRYFDIGPDDPQVLYYAEHIERKLGDEASATAYANELQRLFPKWRGANELEGG